MCGICGFVNFKYPAGEDDAAIVDKMNGRLLHRGPDAQKILLLDNVALGFSRLSIIGLDNGMQPIYNEDDSVVVICNGEIFNYIELRRELIGKGHHFRTDSDVEVLVHLYEESGYDFLNALNGQFAFVLYDRKKATLFCARDQMGIIPFFYTVTEQAFIFASEIKSILEHPSVVREVDMTGLDQILTFAGLVSPRTMFRNINSLENGHFLVVNREGKVTNKEYWDLVFPEEGAAYTAYEDEYYMDRLEELIESSIRLRLRSDVPLGLYLSGGLDSSIITMKAGALAGNVKREAFSIDFIDSGLSEFTYQQMVAKASNTTLNRKVFFYDDICNRLKKSVYHSECPIKETYNTASLSLSESVREKGVKVILSGEGADELFAGYVGYRFDKMRTLNLIDSKPGKEEAQLRQKIWGDTNFFYERNYHEFNAVKKQLYAKDKADTFDEFDCLNHQVINKEKIEGLDILHKRAYIDFKLRLVDHLVSDHGDRMALANAVEVRYPFLDKELVEFSCQIPPDLKLMDFTEKYILKKMASRFVPKAVVDREKFGFVAPGSPYLLQKGNEYVHHLLSADVISKQGYFNPVEVDRLRKIYSQEGFTVNAPFEDDLLMPVITFGMFLDNFFD